MSKKVIGVHKLHDDAVVPFKGTELSACYDICACLHTERVKVYDTLNGIKVDNFGTPDASITLYTQDMALIPTGIVFIIPPNYHLKFFSRSGNVWKRKLVVANAPAIIDADYTHESFVMLYNRSHDPIRIKTGDAIAQCELAYNIPINFEEIDEKYFERCCEVIKKYSSRDGGIGSTDKK